MFSFNFPVPHNPFSGPPVDAAEKPQHEKTDQGLRRYPSISPVRRDLKRPRALEPSSSSQNLSVTHDTAVGYLDTPAKYRDLAQGSSQDYCMTDMNQQEGGS